MKFPQLHDNFQVLAHSEAQNPLNAALGLSLASYGQWSAFPNLTPQSRPIGWWQVLCLHSLPCCCYALLHRTTTLSVTVRVGSGKGWKGCWFVNRIHCVIRSNASNSTNDSSGFKSCYMLWLFYVNCQWCCLMTQCDCHPVPPHPLPQSINNSCAVVLWGFVMFMFPIQQPLHFV